MDKAQALQAFWSSFGLIAYDATSVPDNATLPYITYVSAFSSLGSSVTLTANVWYRSTKQSDVMQKTQEISDSIGGGVNLRYDTGTLFVTKAGNFAQTLSDPDDDMIRGMHIILNGEYTSVN